MSRSESSTGGGYRAPRLRRRLRLGRFDARAAKGHTSQVDEHLAELNQHVAAAAEAWLNDPRDSAVYGRLVAAVQSRRLHLSPAAEPIEGCADGPEDVDLGDLSGRRAPRPIGASLGEDPVATVRRLSGR